MKIDKKSLSIFVVLLGVISSLFGIKYYLMTKYVYEHPLLVASNQWPGYAPLYLADELNYFDQHIKLKQLTSASEVIHAIRTGSIQAGGLTLDEALTLIDENINLKVITILDFSHGGDVLLGKPSINRLQDLKGKAVAVEYTAVGAVVLDSALKLAGLQPSDISIVNCSVDQHLECYKHNDAVVTFEPNKTHLINQGAVNLFDSSQIPNRIVDVLVVTEAAWHQRELLNNLVSGYFKAREYMREYPEEALAKMSQSLGIQVNELTEAYQGLALPTLEENKQLLHVDEQNNLDVIAQELVMLMKNESLLRQNFHLPSLIDDQFLPEVSRP